MGEHARNDNRSHMHQPGAHPGESAIACDLPDPVACAHRLARLAEAAARLHRLMSGDPRTEEACPIYTNPDGSVETYPMRSADELIAELEAPEPVPPASACAVPARAAA
jgi:hypothetical protein